MRTFKRLKTASYNTVITFIATALGIDHAKRTVEFAAGMGYPTVILTPTRYGKYEPLTSIEEELQTGAESMEQVADYAAQRGVRLCIEAWDRFDTYLITNLAAAKSLAEKINCTNVGVMLDTFHMNIEEKDMAATVRAVSCCDIQNLSQNRSEFE